MRVARRMGAVLTMAAFLTGGAGLAQAGERRPLSPPWLAQSQSFLMATFALKADDVRRLLPRNLEPLADANGMVVATFEMYETARVAGLPGYKTAFVVVDVKGFDSREATPGHYAVWGRVTPQEALSAFRGHFGFPYRLADLTVSDSGGQRTGVIGAPGAELLTIRLEPLAEQPFTGQGAVNMVGSKPGHRIAYAEVPYLTRGNMARIVDLDIRPAGDPVLTLLKDAAPLWALVSSDQLFSYSRPRHD